MFLIDLYTILLFQPLYNLLVLFYLYIPGRDLGVAIIFLTIIVRLILWPLQEKATRSQIVMTRIQPKMKEIQKKYKKDKERASLEFAKIYKEMKINPFTGLLLMFIQFPIIIGMYRVIITNLTPETFSNLYSFVPDPGIVNTYFLGMLNLAEPSVILAIIAGIIMFIQIKFSMPEAEKKNPSKTPVQGMQKQMKYILPIIITIFLTKIASAISLYIIFSTIFGVIQNRIIKERFKKYEEQAETN